MTVYSIANQKGGVGKTTSAINLSASLAELGKKVLLIDLDPQGNATLSLGFNRNEVFVSTYEVMMDGIDAGSAIFPTIQENLMLMPANQNLPGAEVQLAGREGRNGLLKHALRNINTEFDYIFIDCPPSLGILTINALSASDGVLIPMQPEFLALEGLSQLLKTISLVRERLNPALKIAGVLLTMYDSRTNLTREVEAEVRDFFRDETRVFETVIPRTVRLAEAPSHGLPINKYANSSNGAMAYMNLAQEVTDVTQTRFGKGIERTDPGGAEAGYGPAGEYIPADAGGGYPGGGEMGAGDPDRADRP